MDMAKILQENYCFPENLVGMEEAIEQAISSGEILHISDKKTLAAVLTTGVQGALNDPRLIVSYEPDYAPPPSSALPPLSPEQLFRAVSSSIRVEVLENNIGYLRVDRVVSEEVAEKIGPLLLEDIWEKVVHTSSLILDLRYSVSGEMSGIPYMVSYFCDPEPPVHIDTVYDRPSNTTTELWTKPRLLGERYGRRKDLIVLTSKRTMGAAEGVAYTLKHMRRAIIVGERTAGGSVKIEKLRIGETDFFITVPVARAINLVTGQSWEVSGVLPSVNVDAKEALTEAKSLIEVRGVIPKAVQGITDIIKEFYSFTDKIPGLLQHLSSINFFAILSEEDLAAKLNDELQAASEDSRLVIRVMEEPPVVIEEDADPDQMPDDPAFLQALVDNLFQVSILPGNTGYLRFDEFGDASMLVSLEKWIIKKVWEPIKDTDNLIIDLRFNTGGPSAAVPILLSYLHDATPPVHFFTIYDRVSNTTTEFHTLPNLMGMAYGLKRGVYVLTSHLTAMAGEEFAYLMQTLHRGTVIGEVTSGTLLHSSSFQVDDTNIIITVPFMNFIDNHGKCWLGGGIVPDSVISAEEAMDQAHKIIEFHREVHSLVEGTGELLEVHYAIPEAATKVRRVLQSKWDEGSYRSVVDYKSLATHLTADLQETTGDHRLHIFTSDTEPEALQESPKIPTPEEVRHIVDAVFKVEVLPGNVGYLRFDMMADAEILKEIGPQLLDLVWNKLVNTTSLIIDMRYNTGGYSTSVPLLCTYFFNAEPRRHLYTIFDRSTTTMTEVMTLSEVPGDRYGSEKDVYILTSHMTGSAAEAFTRTMKDLNRALVIGEPTVGGSLSSGTYQVGNSVLYASIPNQVVLSAVTGKVWSASGVEPHVVAQASEALNVAQKIIGATHPRWDAEE
ncbi:retinol-binding protein 3-like [Megalops cyprinoides]|uniref:retinol-binding protein 3-like n=1 Tax=Megalops cyprinoides TaxID=118141 RepID=UPI001864CAA6|nr:retinol-binding protein 3-like [Megalops cyprinoides]